ncbi:MAG: serine/threonine-protein kinase [Phycisphaerales bacterium]|nr:serine/threonine-protein kinase [Phycisphaerales bacterium]
MNDDPHQADGDETLGMPPRPLDGPETSSEQMSRLPPSIGRYRLIETIGWGGMGVVYRAAQDRPARTVAVKLLRPECADPIRARRMEQEAEVLGRLQHPGIAQVFDAGTWDSGFGAQPFLAMEFIDGVTLVEYAGAHGLDREARIELVIMVCDAVQHAHDRGVLHRDLKPSNILVTQQGHPKVLDFGVATLTDPVEGLRQTLTASGTLIGTTAYMSPEQASGAVDEIDERSDVYAIGVIAYELLAGRLPLDLGGLTLAGMVKVIQETPPRSLGSIDSGLGGDLQVVLEKALSKEQGRRYASPRALADELRRVLDHEPIQARPASSLYRTGRFVRRHRVLVGASAAVVLVLLLGAIVSTVLAIQAIESERSAMRRLQQLRGLATSMVVDLEDRIMDVQGATELHEFTVQTGLQYLAELEQEALADPALRRDAAYAWGRIADVQGNPNRGNLGRLDDALESYSQGIAIAGGAAFQDLRRSLLLRRAQVLLALGRLQDAEADLGAAESIPNHDDLLAGLEMSATRARVEAAQGLLNESLETLRAASVQATAMPTGGDIRAARVVGDLAVSLLDAGIASEAVRRLDDAEAMWLQLAEAPKWQQVARAARGRLARERGLAMVALGRSEEAAAIFESQARRARGRAWNDPTNERAATDLGDALSSYGQALSGLSGRQEEAVALLREAEAVLAAVASTSESVEVHHALAGVRGKLVDVERAESRYEAAYEVLDRAERDLAAAAAGKDDRSLRIAMASLALDRAELMRHQRVDRPQALDIAQAAVQELEAAYEEGLGGGELTGRLIAGQLALLRLQTALGHFEQAIASGRRAVVLADSLTRRDPGNLLLTRTASMAHRYLGDALSGVGKTDEAIAEIDAAIALMEASSTLDPSSDQLQRSLAATHYRAGLILRRAERWDEARAAFEASAAIDQARLDRSPESHLAMSDVMSAVDKVASCQMAVGDMDAAAISARRSVSLAERMLEGAPDAVERQRQVASSTLRLLQACVRGGRSDEASAVFDRLEPQLTAWLEARPEHAGLRQSRASMCMMLATARLPELKDGNGDPAARARFAALLDEAEAILTASIQEGSGGAREEAGLKHLESMRVDAGLE